MGVRLCPPLSLTVSSRPARLQGQGWLNQGSAARWDILFTIIVVLPVCVCVCNK